MNISFLESFIHLFEQMTLCENGCYSNTTVKVFSGIVSEVGKMYLIHMYMFVKIRYIK